MKKNVEGKIVELDGEKFYKIENYDLMTDFFMTITSSSDVWNFCWAQGGITAGRKNSDNAIFPYYTCDKIKDLKNKTGAFSIIKIQKDGRHGIIWQPFASFNCNKIERKENIHLTRNLYKSTNGSKIWFEEINAEVGLSFRYGWTSSEKYGLVKTCRIENITEKTIKFQILDGVKNILPAQITSDLQNSKSVLVDAYRKTELDKESNIALFTLSSLITDKAEPAECLYTNVAWFTTDNPIQISKDATKDFLENVKDLKDNKILNINGKRTECFFIRETELQSQKSDFWELVLDTNYDVKKLLELKNKLKDRMQIRRELYDDIEKTNQNLDKLISKSDGEQKTANEISDIHHKTNVMFNIMRGGIFQNEKQIKISDFMNFVSTRNKTAHTEFSKIFTENKISFSSKLERNILESLCKDNPQHLRLFLEYIPISFSRRHGDPSRPWNKFNIELYDENDNQKLYYEGNWRDIFQNWEALLFSYPKYTKNICVKFLNAMTVDGFNPYRILREGIDWEVPEENNPWAQYGYWTDHQVIYLQKILEFYYKTDKNDFLNFFNEKIFSTANVPYRFKSYEEIYSNPKNSISFDYKLDESIKKEELEYGTDARLILTLDKKVQLTSFATKITQLILGKAFNIIPGAGLWMNTQRPEWNDANNALAGNGSSVVSCCQLYRMLNFFINLSNENDFNFEINATVLEFLKALANLYEVKGMKAISDEKERKDFVDYAGKFFEKERNILYKNGFDDVNIIISSQEFAKYLEKINKIIKETILFNKKENLLFESYNTVILDDDKITIKNLKLMLEGQVAILSADLLNEKEVVALLKNLKESNLFEENQYSYLLYPKIELPSFLQKNNISKEDIEELEPFIKRSNSKIFTKDFNKNYHFNPAISNSNILKSILNSLDKKEKADETEEELIINLYEKIFKHQNFTGRSGAFYGYEGIACIYWHMVSKLLLAVQENLIKFKNISDEDYEILKSQYQDIKVGLGSSKTPDKYGAFPFDPYSHTPYLQGAKQPGMTGQVKEEILNRFLELGIDINDGKVSFDIKNLSKKEFLSNKIEFSWCGTKIIYKKNKKAQNKYMEINFENKEVKTIKGTELDKEISNQLFQRDIISKIIINF